jgi:hypothetical protein
VQETPSWKALVKISLKNYSIYARQHAFYKYNPACKCAGKQ